MSSRPDDERDLEAFLARDTPLQRRWRDAVDDEPSPALDEALGAAARDAVSGPRQHVPSPFMARWRVPMSIAAVLVVSATLTLMVADRREHLPQAEMQGAPAAAVPAPPAPNEAAPAHESARPSAAAPASIRAAQEPRERAARPPGVPAGLPKQQARGAGAEVVERKAQDPAAALGTLKEDSPPPAAPLHREEAPAVAPAPAPALRDQVPAVAAPAAPARQRAAKREAQVPEAVPASPAAAGAASDAATLPAPAAANQAAPQSAEHEGFEQDPQRWVEHIRMLRSAGKLEQARDSLRELRRRHPRYVLPADLEPLR